MGMLAIHQLMTLAVQIPLPTLTVVMTMEIRRGKPGKGPDPDPPDGDDPDGGDDPEVTEVKISRREADKVVVPSFPTVPHLDNWMALWCMC